MLRSKLRNKFLEDKTNGARGKYRKQHNICVHFLLLDVSNVMDNRKSWKTIRPLFANKTKVENKITLDEVKD